MLVTTALHLQETRNKDVRGTALFCGGQNYKQKVNHRSHIFLIYYKTVNLP